MEGQRPPREHRAASEGTLPLSCQRQGPAWSPTALDLGAGPKADPELPSGPWAPSPLRAAPLASPRSLGVTQN